MSLECKARFILSGRDCHPAKSPDGEKSKRSYSFQTFLLPFRSGCDAASQRTLTDAIGSGKALALFGDCVQTAESLA